jgi:hypothetical protein
MGYNSNELRLAMAGAIPCYNRSSATASGGGGGRCGGRRIAGAVVFTAQVQRELALYSLPAVVPAGAAQLHRRFFSSSR